MKPFWKFLQKESYRGEKVKLSIGENRKAIALSILEIFEFKLCEQRYVCVCVCALSGIFQNTGHMRLI